MENGFLPDGLKLLDPRQAVKRVGHAIASVLHHLPESGYPSDHANRGAERALEEALGYDKSRGSEDMNRWDDQGTYFNGDDAA